MNIACIFPGQGSQSPGMLAEFNSSHPGIISQTFGIASEVLDFDLWSLCQDGPEEKLNATENTQPALLAASVATWRILETSGATARVLAGHSLGEYSALVCAGAIEFADAVHLVAFRGQVMQQAVAPGAGAMAAILGLEDDVVSKVCEDAAEGDVVEAVNFNSPGQVVIAGDSVAVNRAIDLATQRGAKRAIKLPVSVPSHCELMKPAADRMAEKLQETEIKPPEIPVIHNVDVQEHDDAEEIRNALVAQLYSPVRWVESIKAIKGRGIETVIECGPGKVLTGLNKRIDRKMSALPVFDPASLEKAMNQMEK